MKSLLIYFSRTSNIILLVGDFYLQKDCCQPHHFYMKHLEPSITFWKVQAFFNFYSWGDPANLRIREYKPSKSEG